MASGPKHQDLNALAARKSIENPATFLRHQACVTSILWRIIPFENEFMGLPPMTIEQMPEARELGLTFEPKLPRLHDLVQRVALWSARPGQVWIFWRPAFWMYLSVLVSAGLWLSVRDARFLLLVAPGVLNTASLAPLIGSPDWRYQYPVVTCGLLVAPILLGRRPWTRPGIPSWARGVPPEGGVAAPAGVAAGPGPSGLRDQPRGRERGAGVATARA